MQKYNFQYIFSVTPSPKAYSMQWNILHKQLKQSNITTRIAGNNSCKRKCKSETHTVQNEIKKQ